MGIDRVGRCGGAAKLANGSRNVPVETRLQYSAQQPRQRAWRPPPLQTCATQPEDVTAQSGKASAAQIVQTSRYSLDAFSHRTLRINGSP
jgi:hypothetical protein